MGGLGDTPPGGIARVKAIFGQARELSAAERSAFLEQACAGDADLRGEVDAFLAAEEQAGDFLGQPTADERANEIHLTSAPIREGPGTTVGRYKILQSIGEGGFGSVFMAEQQTPVRRMVALKIIKLGMDTRQIIARFEAERQVLAMMDHPNIAKVLDAGETETGRPFFVMELVKGIPITQYCDINKLPTNERLGLFMAVCNALQHAHQKGVIHRDIKPGNILVTLHDGKPVPKLIDFGIAKATQSRLTEKTLFTEFRQLIGTPAYMSPEQAEMSGLDVDTRSDIYSLGVLLYELLTGTTPFDARELCAAAYGEIQRIIREVDPPKPSTRLSTLGEPLAAIAANRDADPRKLSQLVRGELDWIVMKALEKDRTRRYESAGEFARDIGRHLNDQPVEACPPSAVYRLRKFAHRNMGTVSATAAVVTVAVVAAVLYIHAIRSEQRKTLVALDDARTQRNEAEFRRAQADSATIRAQTAETQANDHLVRSALAQARGSGTSLEPGRRFDSLAALAAVAKLHPSTAIRSQAIQCMALADLRTIQEWYGAGDAVCMNHACTLCAAIDSKGDALISRVPAPGAAPDPPMLRLKGPVNSWRVEFSSDDRLVALSGTNGHVRVYSLDGNLTLDVENGPAFDFTPDGNSIAAAKPGGPVVIYDLRSGKPIKTLQWTAGDAMAFSPDGRKLAMWSQYASKRVVVGEVATGESAPLELPALLFRAAWHPDSIHLAVGDSDGLIYRWDVSTLASVKSLPSLAGHSGNVVDVKYSHGGDLLASSSWDGTTRIWDAVSGEPLLRMFGAGLVKFGPDDAELAIIGEKYRLTRIETGRERRTLLAPPGDRGRNITFSSDGKIMAYGGMKLIRFWNLSDFSPTITPLDLPMATQVRALAFNLDGSNLIASTNSGIWRVAIGEIAGGPVAQDGTTIRRLAIDPAPTEFLALPTRADGAIQASADGQHIAVTQYGQEPRVLDLDKPGSRTRLFLGSYQTAYISISSDRKWVATGTWNGQGGARVVVWNASAGLPVQMMPITHDANVAFTPDNRWLLTSTRQEYQFWEAGSWKLRRTIPRVATQPGAIVISPDSRLVAISVRETGVQLIDIETGNEIATFDDRGEETPIGFSPDGGQLVTNCTNGILRFWDLRHIRQNLAEMGLDWPEPSLAPRKPSPRIDLSLLTPTH